MIKIPSVEECARVLGEPAEKWAGRCYEIAHLFVDAGLVPGGVAVYGHWTGPIHPASRFAGRRTLGFTQHGWVWVEDEGVVVDPTRWAFEMRTPYVYVGEEPNDWGVVPCADCGFLEEEHDDGRDDCGGYQFPDWPYDEGGNAWRAATLPDKPAPVPGPDEPRFTLKLEGTAAQAVAVLLGQADGTIATDKQIFWLANLPYQLLGDGAAQVYEAICAAADYFAGFIPYDNQIKAAREGGFKRT